MSFFLSSESALCVQWVGSSADAGSDVEKILFAGPTSQRKQQITLCVWGQNKQNIWRASDFTVKTYDSVGAEDFGGGRLVKACFVVFQFGCLMGSAVSARPNEAWRPGGLCLSVGCSGPQQGIADFTEGFSVIYRALFCADPLVPKKGEVHTIVFPQGWEQRRVHHPHSASEWSFVGSNWF